MSGIAILGAGIFATEEHLPSLKRASADLKAVYSRSTASATKLRDAAYQLGYSAIDLYSDDSPDSKTLDDLLQRPDIRAVVVVLPIPVQPDIVRKCLAAGKHVLCEKPIAKDVATAKALVSEYLTEYSSRGLIFSIAEQFRFIKAHEVARQWVTATDRSSSSIGTLTQIHLRMWGYVKPGGKYYETEWRKTPQYQGGFLLDGGVHFLALLRYVSAQEVVETKSFARQTADHLPPADTINAALVTSGGATGTISMSFASAKQGWEAAFLGTRGGVSISGAGRAIRVEFVDLDGNVVEEFLDESNGVDLEVAAFLEAVARGKEQRRASAVEGYNDVALIESLLNEGGKVDNWK